MRLCTWLRTPYLMESLWFVTVALMEDRFGVYEKVASVVVFGSGFLRVSQFPPLPVISGKTVIFIGYLGFPHCP